jgi:outer membrane protein assembly factor BamB
MTEENSLTTPEETSPDAEGLQPEANDQQAANVQPTVPSRGRIRWKIAAGIALAGAATLAVMWNSEDGDQSAQVIDVIKVVPATLLLLILWWIAISGVRWTTRFIGVGVLAAFALLFLAAFRLDGFTGDFIPQLSLRSSPTQDERMATFFEKETAGAGAPDSTSASDERLEVTDGDWPGFRGPLQDGILRTETIRTDWDDRPPKQLWRHPVGLGWSSFAVVGEYAFTQEQREQEELVVCYDVESGKQIWTHVDKLRFNSAMGGDGPRGTPTIVDSRLYALGATGILNCLNPLTGEVLWSRDIFEEAGVGVPNFGMSSSPLVYDDVVVVNPGGNEQNNKGLIAYDRVTGDVVWAHGRLKTSYATPRVEVIDGTRQILSFGRQGVAGHDAASGEALWFFEWFNDTGNNCVQPILLDDGTLFVSTGYGTGSVLLKIEKDESGKWKDPEPTGWKTNRKFKLKFNGGVLKDGYIYALNEGILACLDVETGKQTWKRGRYKYGQVLLIDDVLLVLAEDGDVALVEANPKKFREITRMPAIEGKTWNHPVVHQGRLLVRNADEAACFDLR